MRGNKTLFVVVSFLLLAVSASAYTIDGDTVTYEDAHVRVSVFPHTCRDANLDCTFYANVTNKDNATLNPNLAFVFPDELIDADLAEVVSSVDSVDSANGTVEMPVSDFDAKTVDDMEYNGSVAYKENISLTGGQTKQYQWSAKLNPALGTEGKFDVVLWTGDINSPSWKFVLDPWWNATDTVYWYEFTNDLVDSSGNGNDLDFGGSGNSHDSTRYKTGGYSVKNDGNGNIRKTSGLTNFPSGNANFTWMMWSWPDNLPAAGGLKRIYSMCENIDPPTANKAFKIGLSNVSGQYNFVVSNQGAQNLTSSDVKGLINATQPFGLAVTYNATANEMKLYLNNMSVGNRTFDTAPNWQFDVVSIGDWYCGDGNNRYAGSYDDVRMYRSVLTGGELSKWFNYSFGTTSQELTAGFINIMTQTYNVTNAVGDGTVWRVNINAPVEVQAQPNVLFQTDQVGNCSIGLHDWNYTYMVQNDSATRCSTINATNMNCTLPISQSLVFGTQSLYLSCVGNSGTDVGSTSQGLNLSYAAAHSESTARDAIEAGMLSALGNPSILTDQQIYVRRLNGTQQLATFDKVAVSGNQRWAFNYLTGTDVYQNMGNLTPVLYTFETTNISEEVLQSEVTAFIQNTKN